MTGSPRVVVLDYGSGNLRSAQRALEHVGAAVTVTGDYEAALGADALLVPGVGAFGACMAGLRAVRGPELIGRRLAGGRPVLGVCVGMQVLFERSEEPWSGPATDREGCAEWPGTVQRLEADVVPHMGWSPVTAAPGSRMFRGIEDQRFYFVHSYAVGEWLLAPDPRLAPPLVSWSEHGHRFVAAVENGPLWATQFHPEKSGPAGLTLLRNWLDSVTAPGSGR